MKERPILFSPPMVRAILAGQKTQTRRAVKPVGNDEGFVLVQRDDGSWWPWRSDDGESSSHTVKRDGGEYRDETPHRCPYGKTGDRLWVKETWSTHAFLDDTRPSEITTRSLHYWADGDIKTGKKRPSIFMPRWASRILLEIVSVRVERLQDISEPDCIAEGAPGGHRAIPGYAYNATPLEHYKHIWTSINGQASWDANPWVWVVEFKHRPAGDHE